MKALKTLEETIGQYHVVYYNMISCKIFLHIWLFEALLKPNCLWSLGRQVPVLQGATEYLVLTEVLCCLSFSH